MPWLGTPITSTSAVPTASSSDGVACRVGLSSKPSRYALLLWWSRTSSATSSRAGPQRGGRVLGAQVGDGRPPRPPTDHSDLHRHRPGRYGPGARLGCGGGNQRAPPCSCPSRRSRRQAAAGRRPRRRPPGARWRWRWPRPCSAPPGPCASWWCATTMRCAPGPRPGGRGRSGRPDSASTAPSRRESPTWRGRGVDRVVVAHADLPLATELAWLADFDGVTLVPDRHLDGTNVACVPADAGFRFAYGAGSFSGHRAEAARLGLVARLVPTCARLGRRRARRPGRACSPPPAGLPGGRRRRAVGPMSVDQCR